MGPLKPPPRSNAMLLKLTSLCLSLYWPPPAPPAAGVAGNAHEGTGLPPTNPKVPELDSVEAKPEGAAGLNAVLDCALAAEAAKRTAKTKRETCRKSGIHRGEDMSGPRRGTRIVVRPEISQNSGCMNRHIFGAKVARNAKERAGAWPRPFIFDNSLSLNPECRIAPDAGLRRS